jgi:hypothetical protein
LRELVDGLQSGVDSGLTNTWEEICVQVQGEQSVLWDAYDVTVRQIVSMEVTALPELNAMPCGCRRPRGNSGMRKRKMSGRNLLWLKTTSSIISPTTTSIRRLPIGATHAFGSVWS